MTRDDIIRMAKQVGIEFDPRCGTCLTGNIQLERFAALVAAEKDREILALKEERRKDMAEIYSLRESEESLREKNEQFAALREQLRLANIDALNEAAKNDSLDRENERLREELAESYAVRERCNERAFRLEAENERLRDAARQMRSHDETAIWAARHDPRE